MRFNPDGSPDATFGGDGKVTARVGSQASGAFDVALQPGDGNVVAAGFAGGMFAVARFLAN